MIRIGVDDRIGSRELAEPLARMGAVVKVRRLAFGDITFAGQGPTGLVRIGVERKTVEELVNTITDSRFAGYQVPGLLRTYPYPYLLVEGLWRPDPRSGVLLTMRRGQWVDAGRTRRRLMYAEFAHYLTTIETCAGLRIIRSASFSETVYAIHALATWWDKDWAKHRSHRQVYETKPDSAILERQSLLRRMAAQIPDVGWVRSRAVEAQFTSVRAMVTAEEAMWTEIRAGKNGARFGKARAARVVAGLNGKEPPEWKLASRNAGLAHRSFG